MLQGWDNFRWSWHWFTAALMMDSGLADCMFNLFGVFNLPLFGWKRCGKISGLIILSQRCSLLLVHILVYSYWFSLIGRLWRCRSYHLLIWIVSDLGWALLGRKVLTTDYIFFFICFTTSHHETVVFLIGSELLSDRWRRTVALHSACANVCERLTFAGHGQNTEVLVLLVVEGVVILFFSVQVRLMIWGLIRALCTFSFWNLWSNSLDRRGTEPLWLRVAGLLGIGERPQGQRS